ncbi:uncharacterized protein LOC110835572 [Zootermopsis nevadensis]|uniref:uncharacterized protein LOC110835572 n=1 Tax=Zootermopsis nevadensis TaxID=136037 RepID=UPI000B8E89A7|nr:uncharacterized protein LOC110835572 [Zootermopsis nevadensis]
MSDACEKLRNFLLNFIDDEELIWMEPINNSGRHTPSNQPDHPNQPAGIVDDVNRHVAQEEDTDSACSSCDESTEQIECVQSVKEKDELHARDITTTPTPGPTDSVTTSSVEYTAMEQKETNSQLSPSNTECLIILINPSGIVLSETHSPHCPAAIASASSLNSSVSDVLNDVHDPYSIEKLTNLGNPEANESRSTSTNSLDGDDFMQNKVPAEKRGEVDTSHLNSVASTKNMYETLERMATSSNAIPGGNNQLTIQEKQALREERFKSFINAPQEIKGKWKLLEYINSERDPETLGHSVLEDCKDMRRNEVNVNARKPKDLQIFNKSVNDMSKPADPSPMEHLNTSHLENSITSEDADSSSEMFISAATIFFNKIVDLCALNENTHLKDPLSSTEVGTQTTRIDECDTTDLLTVSYKKDGSETSDQMSTFSTEAIHNQLTFSKKLKDPDASEHVVLEDRQKINKIVNDKSESSDSSSMEHLNIAHLENSITSEDTDSSAQVFDIKPNSVLFNKTNVPSAFNTATHLENPQSNTKLRTETISSNTAMRPQEMIPMEMLEKSDTLHGPTDPRINSK